MVKPLRNVHDQLTATKSSTPSLCKNHKSIIIEVESIWKLGKDTNPNRTEYYDYVLIDEVESILTQLTVESTHGKRMTEYHQMFNNLLLNAKQILMMGWLRLQ